MLAVPVCLDFSRVLTALRSGSIVCAMLNAAMMPSAFIVRTAYRIEGGPNGLGGFVGFPPAR